MKLALVSTFVRAQPVLAHWVSHHRALGVQCFYLFVDDPAELADYRALDLGNVQLIARDAALSAAWQTLSDWAFHGKFVADQVYSRQCLNADLAMQKARDAGCDWLIHLDMDECLHVPDDGPTLPEYFAGRKMFDVVTFTNHEAVPEQWHVGNYFAEVTLFKRNRLTLSEAQQRIVQGLFGARYFLAYGNGKSAVNLHGRAVEADGCHLFRPAGMIHVEATLCVLHFTHCGFNWFYLKFAILGEFDGKLMGFSEITQTFPMLAEGRDAVVRGSIHEATRLYRDSILHQAGMPHSTPALIEAGVLMRLGASPLQAL